MPAVSKAQQHFFGMLKHNPDKMKKSLGSMPSAKVIDEFASTPTKDLPERAKKHLRK
jgi:hypothetical protein